MQEKVAEDPAYIRIPEHRQENDPMSMTLSASHALRVMRVEREFRWTASVYGIKRINVRYIWTPGHCGVAMNKLVDNLCTQAGLSNKPLYVVNKASRTFPANVRSYSWKCTTKAPCCKGSPCQPASKFNGKKRDPSTRETSQGCEEEGETTVAYTDSQQRGGQRGQYYRFGYRP
ncbi:hypothetical protein QC762_0084320 [Podospora pseudocomata]|uniref:RNase H type-1 domain-containing protein n=1 Tax=Podospora pseudocomata TaxID=2093779 RepID=A0ABR0GCR7_9PEZI|nr:hypothetical protein QC762_0084320 [Podospora pseudocomata]